MIGYLFGLLGLLLVTSIIIGVAVIVLYVKCSPMADERGAFEAWAQENGFDVIRHSDESYATSDCADAWLGWQARAEYWTVKP